MASHICFDKHVSLDPKTNRMRDEEVVIRDGREVAVLPEANRLDRALSLSLEEAAWIARHFQELMHREPTEAEREFWRAAVDYRRAHAPIEIDAT